MVQYVMHGEVWGGVVALWIGLRMPFMVLVACLVVLVGFFIGQTLKNTSTSTSTDTSTSTGPGAGTRRHHGIKATTTANATTAQDPNTSDDDDDEEEEEEDNCLAQLTQTLAQEQERQAQAHTSDEDDADVQDRQDKSSFKPLTPPLSMAGGGRRRSKTRAKSVRDLLLADSFNHVPQASLHARFLKIDATGQLLPSDQQDARDTTVQVNSLKPFEFDTDLARGQLLVLVRNEHYQPEFDDEPPLEQGLPAAYAPLFRGKRRRFWIQLQVQFKQLPRGILFIGGEIPRPMKLGFFSLGLTKIILSLVRSLVRGLHYSFGKFLPNQPPHKQELPHICFPLYSAVDQFVVTKPGQTPPKLGTSDFGEPTNQMAHRRHSGKLVYEYNTEDIYSFHFHSYFLDFMRWHLVDLPGMRDSDLKVFLADMPLRIFAYNLRPNDLSSPDTLDETTLAQEMNRVHACGQKEYKLCLELSHRLDTEQEAQAKLPDLQHQPEQPSDPMKEPSSSSSSSSSLSKQQQVKQAPETAQQEQQGNELDQALQAFEFNVPIWLEYWHGTGSSSARKVGYVFRIHEYEQEQETSCEQRGSVASTEASSSATSDTSCRPLKRDSTVFLSAEAAFEPLFLLQKSHPLGNLAGLANATVNSTTPALDAALDETITVHAKRRRYSRIEEERQFLEQSLVELMTIRHGTSSISSQIDHHQLFCARQALLELLQGKKSYLGQQNEWPLLDQASVAHCKGPKRLVHQEMSQVVRIESTTCWRNEWLRVDKKNRNLRFFRINSVKAHLTIPISEIVSVHTKVPTWVTCDVWSPCLYWLQIGTLAKSHHLAFGTMNERDWWCKAVRRQVTLQCGVDFSSDGVVDGFATKRMEQLHLDFFTDCSFTNSKFGGIKRFVLNQRFDALVEVERTIVAPLDSANETLSNPNANPSAFVGNLLRRVLDFSQRTCQITTVELVQFLEHVAYLRWIAIPALLADEQERKCFFLNVYHLLLLQAKLFGVLPRAPGSWTKFFNGTSYNIGGMLFSLAEIEHCVLRAPNGALRVALSKLVLPRFHSEDKRVLFSLTQRDLRINFALNGLAKSCLSWIPIFDTEKLNQQLDDVMVEYLEETVVVNVRRKEVRLPRICLWYQDDFVTPKSPSETACSRSPPRPSTPVSPPLVGSPGLTVSPVSILLSPGGSGSKLSRKSFAWKNRLAREVFKVLLPSLQHGKNWPVLEKQLCALVTKSYGSSRSMSSSGSIDYVVDWQEVCASGQLRCRFRKYDYSFQDQVHAWHQS